MRRSDGGRMRPPCGPHMCGPGQAACGLDDFARPKALTFVLSRYIV